VDRIAGYRRWQNRSRICGEEAERLAARKKAAEGRLSRRDMLLAAMARGLKSWKAKAR
jgi:hypothetical protein